jgi:hypothetical protein
MTGWTRLAGGGLVAVLLAVGIGDTASAQAPQRLVVRNIEGRGTYRSVVHSLRQWQGQNNAITTETVDCDMQATFHGDGSTSITGTIAMLRETIRDGRRIGRTEIRGGGNNVQSTHRLRLGYVPGQPGGMAWANWTPDALEVPVEISIGDNAPIGHTLYCETRLKGRDRPRPLSGTHTGPLTSVDVMIKPSPIAKPGGLMLQIKQTVELTWDFAPL